MIRRPPRSPLFPSTPLFRSQLDRIVPQAAGRHRLEDGRERAQGGGLDDRRDRKSTRLNSSHSQISYAVFCLKKKKTDTTPSANTVHTAHASTRTATVPRCSS